jgi:hypothetical protein
MKRSAVPRLLIQAYLLGLPLWWGMGIDFIMPWGLCFLLACFSLGAHQRFVLSDYLLIGIILSLATSAYINGFLVAHEFMRFVAALFNLSLWICGLILIQQVRRVLEQNNQNRCAILRTGFWTFVLMTFVAWGPFALAYVVHDFSLEMPSLFGLTLGHAIPDSASLIKQSARVIFTRPDWGLPGVPMPRIVVYGPYPTATGAVVAVLGTLALLHVQLRHRGKEWAIIAVEGVIVLTIAITLTRSVLGGWIFGAVAANLIFGSAWRRIAACGVLASALIIIPHIDMTDAVEYRGYSTESRFENYGRAVDQTVLSNPILGLGIKPREEGNHIAVGSHSTFVSSFTKGGALGLGFVVAFLVIVPAFRWLAVAGGMAGSRGWTRSEMRVLFNLQAALWVWICFEDIDAPATASMLIFLSFAVIESALRPAGVVHRIPAGHRAIAAPAM